MNEQALKERLKSISKEQGKQFGEIWKNLCLERFLSRIAKSIFRDQFVFKGGLLLSRYIKLGRETKDVDFLANKINTDAPNVEKAFIEICAAKINDGFTFMFSDLSPLDQPHMNYPGYRVILDLKFGEKMKDKIQVDVGVGDIVDPKSESLELFQYKGKPIFEGAITLQVYPPETIFAEKIETIASKGAANSRMKDFHDLLLLCREIDLLNIKKVKGDVEKTFRNRNTSKDSLPLKFKEDDYVSMNKHWSAHLRKLGQLGKKLSLPVKIESVVLEINNWIEDNSIL